MKRILMVVALALLFCPALAYAQTDPNIPGLNWAGLLTAAATIIFLTNMAKDVFHIQGKIILAVSGGFSLAWGIATYQPDVQLTIIASVFCWMVATGTWAGAKKLAHKIGQPSAKK